MLDQPATPDRYAALYRENGYCVAPAHFPKPKSRS